VIKDEKDDLPLPAHEMQKLPSLVEGPEIQVSVGNKTEIDLKGA